MYGEIRNHGISVRDGHIECVRCGKFRLKDAEQSFPEAKSFAYCDLCGWSGDVVALRKILAISSFLVPDYGLGMSQYYSYANSTC